MTRASWWIGAILCAACGWSWAPQAQAQMQKSAQSDCTREASRRGYAVLSTGNFRQYRDGWSMDLQVRDSRGRVSSGTCFVHTSTGDVSLYGFGWGGEGGGGAGFEFNCASIEEQYRECQLPVDGRARLVKRLSDARCEEGRSWGQKRDRVWVDRGCRARFAVDRGGGGSGDSQARLEAACSRQAQQEGMRVERVNRGEWNQAGSYWVATVQGVHHNKRKTVGCRYYPRRNHVEINFGGGWDDDASGGRRGAERACLQETERRGYRVFEQTAAFQVQGGYGMQLKVRRGNEPLVSAYCRYSNSTRRAELEIQRH